MDEIKVDRPINSAIEANDIITIKMMLQSGMSLKEPIADGLTPLEAALKHERPAILYLMLDSYNLQQVDVSNERDVIPLMIASAVGYIDFLKKWKSHGLPFNVIDSRGDTPLHHVAKNPWYLKNLLPSVQFLLQCDVKPNALGKYGHNPVLTMANYYIEGGTTCSNFAPIVEEFVNAGADINCRDVFGRTALHYAEFNIKSYHCVETLLILGADINKEDDEGLTCIEFLLPELRQSLEEFYISSINYFSCLHKLVGKLVLHVIKINILGLHVSPKIHSNTQDLLQWVKLVEKLDETVRVKSEFSLNHIETFVEKCTLEREKMKNVKLDGVNSIYKLSITHENELQKFACSRVFQEFFNSNDCITDFPIYGYIIKLQFNKAMTRKLLLPKAKVCLVSLNMPLVDLCFEHILKQFTNKELREFLETSKQCNNIYLT